MCHVTPGHAILGGVTPYSPVPLPPLTAPVWGRQPEETPQAYDAFLGWLMGGAHLRDWAAGEAASGLPRAMLEQLAGRWVWEVRAKEWLANARRVHAEAMAPMRDELAALVAVELRTHRAALELECLELEKLLAKARGKYPSSDATGETALPSTLDPRELAALRRVNVTAREALRRQADGLPPEGVGETQGPDWSRLPPDKLEEYRRLRALAAGERSG